MTRENDESIDVLHGSFSGRLWESDLFARDHPASLEGQPEVWVFARTVIDHGGHLFKKLDTIRSELRFRDLVVQALFRRILITGEAIRLLVERGLEEPVLATSRTLLELERDLRLVVADPTDTRARRLALFLAVKGRRNFAKAASDPNTLDLMKADAHFFEWFRRRSRSFRQWFKSEAFRDLAVELTRADHWHGFATQQEAFEEAGMVTSYHLEYGGSSLFVHGGNIEHDFSDADAGVIQLRALAQRDPAHAFTQLGRLTLSLIEIFGLIWEDRGNPQYQESLTAELAGRRAKMDALDALRAKAISIFPNPRS